MAVELVKSPMPIVPEGAIARLDRLAAALAEAEGAAEALRLRIARPRQQGDALSLLAAMVTARGAGLSGSPSHAAAVAMAQLAARVGRLALPAPPSAPAVAVILCARSTDETLAGLRALGPALAGQSAEILLADDGCDRQIALLPALVRHLRVIGGDSMAAACNLAVAASRAQTVMIMDAAASARFAPPPGGDTVQIGGLGAASLGRFGVALGPAEPGPPGLHLAVSRPLWDAAGGLDPALADGRGLDVADLALKLRLLGARPVPVLAAQADGYPVEPDRAWQAASMFRARWGDIVRETAA